MSNPVMIGNGSFADIWDLQDGTVLKAYRSESRLLSGYDIVDIQDHDLLTSVYCYMEKEAYLNLRQIRNVNMHLPEFIGQKDPAMILSNMNNTYVKGAGLIIEKVEGKDQKSVDLSPAKKLCVEPVLSTSKQNLSNLYTYDSVSDSSCFYESKNKFKIIDFGLWDASDYECYLHDHGVLTQSQKDTLRSLCDRN